MDILFGLSVGCVCGTSVGPDVCLSQPANLKEAQRCNPQTLRIAGYRCNNRFVFPQAHCTASKAEWDHKQTWQSRGNLSRQLESKSQLQAKWRNLQNPKRGKQTKLTAALVGAAAAVHDRDLAVSSARLRRAAGMLCAYSGTLRASQMSGGTMSRSWMRNLGCLRILATAATLPACGTLQCESKSRKGAEPVLSVRACPHMIGREAWIPWQRGAGLAPLHGRAHQAATIDILARSVHT